MAVLRTLCGIILLLSCSGTCTAQLCQPYWAGHALSEVPYGGFGYFFSHDDSNGPALYFRTRFGNVLYRWRHQQWESLPRDGLPKVITAASGVMSLDDGQGPTIYAQLRLTSTWETYRFRDNVWSLMPPHFWPWDASVYTMPMIVADMGDGPHIYGKRPGLVTKWTGTEWETIGVLQNGSGSSRDVHAMIAYTDASGPSIFIFGYFDSVDGVQARGFAKWDGDAWSGPWPEYVLIGPGQRLLRVFDDGSGPKVYSNYQPVFGTIHHEGLHRWDGQTWEFLGGPIVDPFTIVEFFGMHAFDDGSGPGLYISGRFPNFNGLPAMNLVRYDGAGFHAIPGSEASGTGGFGSGCAIRDDRGESLAVLGSFLTTYQTVSFLVGCNEPTCPADCDADGKLNINDFVCFTNAFAARTPFANAQPDAALDIQDFVAFLARFSAGCPQR